MAEKSYPLVLKGELRETPSRVLWLVKWLLLIPHFIALAFLWAAFIVVTFIAFFSILFNGKYPESIFRFNVGVMRWTWRVAFYGYGVLATDLYPPFSLEEEADYPATLEVAYPEHLVPWMVLVKWALAAPHYIILGVLLGGSAYTEGAVTHHYTGLLWILVMITAVVLLFAGIYLKDIFRLVVGICRWCFRVLAYVALMTDQYPPLRFED